MRFLTDEEAETLAAVMAVLMPASADHPGAVELGAVDYVDTALAAFTFDPPRVFTGGPYSGRFGGEASWGEFLPLAPLEELAWRTRIEGSGGDPTREFNGPVRGWQQIYRDGLAALGADFPSAGAQAQRDRWQAAPAELRELAWEHACEACYGPPEYGGNRDLGGWVAIEFPGDVQPRGWTDQEVSGRD
jgi:hypothetical protein